MSEYFLVVQQKPQAGARAAGGLRATHEFVAGFGDRGLAVAYAMEESRRGRKLLVIEKDTGELVFPDPGSVPAPRRSLMRLRRDAAEADDDGGEH